MTHNAVPGFLPSEQGLRFRNTFPKGPVIELPGGIGIGDASLGLCGGMVLTTRDLFEAGIAPPPDTEPPARGTRRFRAIVRRQAQSLDWLRVPLRYWDLQALRPAPRLRRRSAGEESLCRWLPRIRAEIDAGRTPVVGLIREQGLSPLRLTHNHQTLAFAYDEYPDGVALRVYDPNHPGRDDVTIGAMVTPDAGRPSGRRITLRQSTGEPLAGFFLQPYPRPDAIGAWR